MYTRNIEGRSRNHCCRRNKKVLHILSVRDRSLTYSACEARVPYYMVVYYVFQHYLINAVILGKKRFLNLKIAM